MSWDGQYILAGINFPKEPKGIVYLWNNDTGELVNSFQSERWRGQTSLWVWKGPIADVSLSPDSKHFVVIADDGDITLWNCSSADAIYELTDEEHYILPDTGSFTPNGKHVMVVGSNESGHSIAQLWASSSGDLIANIATGLTLMADVGFLKNFSEIAFSPDGLSVAIASADNAVALWDLRPHLAIPRILQSDSGVEIHWDLGALQFSQSLSGPWNIMTATSPFKLNRLPGNRFFRVVVEE